MASLLKVSLLVLFFLQIANGSTKLAENTELENLLEELEANSGTNKREDAKVEFPETMIDNVDHMEQERKLSGFEDTIATDDDSLPIDALYEPVGCFSDRGGKNRPFSVYLGNLRPQIDWYNLNKTIRACAHLAKDKGFRYFAIQFYGECWSGPTADKTYDKDGASDKCVVGVGKSWANFVYRFKGGECPAYKELDSADRSEGYGPTSVYTCDRTLNPEWYRFTGQAGTHMATTCVPKLHCGAHAPGWMTGTLPSVAEGIVNRKVCYNWRNDCCHWSSNISVKNCGGFYVYRLVKPSICRLRYCGSSAFVKKRTIFRDFPESTKNGFLEPGKVPYADIEMDMFLSKRNDQRTFRLCEHKSGVLRCLPGQEIKIHYANYGRTEGRTVCPHVSIRTTKCLSSLAGNLVRCACDGRNSCPLYAKNEVYGDPCVGTFKYIEVKYQCVFRPMEDTLSP